MPRQHNKVDRITREEAMAAALHMRQDYMQQDAVISAGGAFYWGAFQTINGPDTLLVNVWNWGWDMSPLYNQTAKVVMSDGATDVNDCLPKIPANGPLLLTKFFDLWYVVSPTFIYAPFCSGQFAGTPTPSESLSA